MIIIKGKLDDSITILSRKGSLYLFKKKKGVACN